MGFSVWHLIILVLVVLLFFGPQRLPGLGKSLGEAIRGFKKGLDSNEIDVTETSEKLSAKNSTEHAEHTGNTEAKHKDRG